jgi:carboxypeptidase PM20D1
LFRLRRSVQGFTVLVVKGFYFAQKIFMLKRILLLLLVAIVALIVVIVFNTANLKSRQVKVAENEVVRVAVDSAVVVRLSKAIRYKTISFDEPGLTDYSQFDSLHAFFESAFPLVHQKLERTLINKYSALYYWKGKNTNLKPVSMYAHLDVVPVEEASKSQWVVAPFEGTVKDGYIWGRGTLDDKGSAIAILEAVNRLLESGFVPERDIYIAFGHDEEIGGTEGAEKIAAYLASKNVKTEFHLDEGGLVSHGMVPGVSKDFALIGTAEKGFLTLELTVKMNGGHSSRPPKESALGTLITALAKLEAHTFERTVSITVNDFIDFVGPEMDMPLKAVFANKWLFKSVIMDEYQKSVEGNAMVRTTGVPTVLNAGIKENVVPGEASAKVNFRVLQGETTADVIKKVKEIIQNDTVKITPFGVVFEPSKSSSPETYGFKLLQNATAKVFPDACAAPFLMIGSTDSKHFEPVTENAYRYLPVRMDGAEVAKIHGVNERISIAAHMECIAFYETLMKDLK